MRFRAFLPALAVVATCAVVVPAKAVGVPVLTCKWSGLVHVDSDWSWEATLFSFGTGSGRCSGTGAGPYDVTFTQSWGGVEPGGDFVEDVTYRLRSLRNGSVRSVVQDWSGTETPNCTVTPFVVKSGLRPKVGAGNLSLCPSIDGSIPPPEPIDVPAALTWRFFPTS